MNRDFIEYLNGERNATKLEVVISRERSDNGWERVTISSIETGREVYAFWHNNKRNKENPKHSGGKKPYVMLMVDALRKHIEEGMPCKDIGYLIALTGNVRWHDCVLVNKRNKRLLTFSDLCKIWKVSDKTGKEIMRRLKRYGLLFYDKEGYKISDDLIKKGHKK